MKPTCIFEAAVFCSDWRKFPNLAASTRWRRLQKEIKKAFQIMKRWYIFISWTLTVQLFSIQYRIALENKSCYFPGIYIQWHINTWANLICIIYIICIGGQRGGGGGPSPPPFHKNWSEKATKRVNFSKFSWTQQYYKSRPPPFEILWPRLVEKDRFC